jgi:voltage-gated potassium channel
MARCRPGWRILETVVAGSAEALERFERQTAWPMLVLSLAIVPLLVIPLLADLSRSVESTFFALDWLIWGVFGVEYGVRLFLAPRKGEFVRHNVIDLVVVLLPILRPLRVVRSARALRLLRAARGAAFLMRGIDAIQDVLSHRKLHYTLLVAGVVTVGAGLLIAEFESGAPDGNIEGVADGLWWAIVTITTIGYGDRFPVTSAGRGLAVVVMLFGVGVFGLLAGSLASFFIERDQKGEDSQFEEISARLGRIEEALGIGAKEEQ